MTFGSLFAGIGGFDLGLELAGMECRWQVENEPFCVEVLKARWPKIPKFGDVRNCGTRNLAPVDLVCGGFPCQPTSIAGKRKGKDDDRYLWPQMLRIVSELRPAWVLGENVLGIASMVQFDSPLEVDRRQYSEDEKASGRFEVGEVRERIGRGLLDEILDDLEKIGYAVQPFAVPACSVNAPHLRYRVWILARNSESARKGPLGEVPKGKDPRAPGVDTDVRDSERGGQPGEHGGRPGKVAKDGCADVSDSGRGSQGRVQPEPEQGGGEKADPRNRGEDVSYRDDQQGRLLHEAGQEGPEAGRRGKAPSDSDRDGCGRVLRKAGRRKDRSELGKDAHRKGARALRTGSSCHVADPEFQGLEGGNVLPGIRRKKNHGSEGEAAVLGGKDASDSHGGHRAEVPQPDERGVQGRDEKEGRGRSPEPGLGRSADGIPGRLDGHPVSSEEIVNKVAEEVLEEVVDCWPPGWEDGIPRVSLGTPNRAARLKAIGNAVVPPLVEVIGRIILKAEGELKSG